MQYEKPSQAAQRLGVSSRAIQKWAVEGRIEGACKIAGQWMIPTGFTEPAQRGTARTASASTPHKSPVTILNRKFDRGECLRSIEATADKTDKDILYAGYCYYTGNGEQAASIAEDYLDSDDVMIRNSACLIYIYSNLSLGHLHKARFALSIMQKATKTYSDKLSLPGIRALVVWTSHMVTTLFHNPEDALEPLEDWLRHLPGGMKLYACYMIAYKMCQQKKYQGAHAVSKISVEFSDERYIIPEIYCKIIDAVSLMNLKRVADAENQFMAAWELARNDGFTGPFAEHYLLLQGITERCLKGTYPEQYKRITDQAAVFIKSWGHMHNANTGGSFAIDLTITEFSVAMMYTRGWSAKEIAAHLDMSIRTVYRHISNIYATLGIKSVAELKKYMLN